jgi:hypothetical protein
MNQEHQSITDKDALDRMAALARQYGDCGSDFIGDVCNILNETGRSTHTDDDHVILVALQISGAASRAEAEKYLVSRLPRPEDYRAGPLLECWWVAEDDRHDGSDNDSAVFVTPGKQHLASRFLRNAGYTPDCNVVDRQGGQFTGDDEEHVSRCPACGDLIDYCQGHGMLGDSIGATILHLHDEGHHENCHPAGCDEAKQEES